MLNRREFTKSVAGFFAGLLGVGAARAVGSPAEAAAPPVVPVLEAEAVAPEPVQESRLRQLLRLIVEWRATPEDTDELTCLFRAAVYAELPGYEVLDGSHVGAGESYHLLPGVDWRDAHFDHPGWVRLYPYQVATARHVFDVDEARTWGGPVGTRPYSPDDPDAPDGRVVDRLEFIYRTAVRDLAAHIRAAATPPLAAIQGACFYVRQEAFLFEAYGYCTLFKPDPAQDAAQVGA